MRAFHTTFMVAAMSVTIAGTAVAQSNLEKLGAMHTPKLCVLVQYPG